VTSSIPKDPGQALGTWNTTAVADRAYWLRLKVTDCLVDAVGATQELINSHTTVLHRMIWVENGYPQISLGVQYAYVYRTSGAVCNWIKPALLCKYGHLKRDVAEGVAMSFRLRYEEAAQHPNQLVGPKDRTQANLQTLDQLADGSYRGVFPISDSLFHNFLSCGYHNGNWTLSTDGQPVQYTWYDGPRSASPAAVTVEHKNLVVSASPEYLLFDGDAEDPASNITYSLDDAASDANTSVTVEIYASDQQLVMSDTFTTSTGTGKMYTWNGTDSPGTEGVLQPKGIYLYRITATQAAQADSDCEKSTWTIPSTTAEIGAPEESDQAMMRVGYRIETEYGCGAQTATSAKVDVFNQDLAVVGGTSTNSPTVNTDDQFPDFSISTAAMYIAVVSAIDNDSAHDRNHFNRAGGHRPLLQRNRRLRPPTCVVVIDPGHGGTKVGARPNWAHENDDNHDQDQNLLQSERLRYVLEHHSSYSYVHSNPSQRWIRYRPIYLTRTANITLSFKERVAVAAKAEKYRQDHGLDYILFISEHNDSGLATNINHSLVEHRVTRVTPGSHDLQACIVNRIAGTTIPPPPPDRPATRDYVPRDTDDRLPLLYTLWANEKTRNVPGVLIEQVYLHTLTDENLLLTGDFRNSFAIQTHRGIDDFLVPAYIPGIGGLYP